MFCIVLLAKQIQVIVYVGWSEKWLLPHFFLNECFHMFPRSSSFSLCQWPVVSRPSFQALRETARHSSEDAPHSGAATSMPVQRRSEWPTKAPKTTIRQNTAGSDSPPEKETQLDWTIPTGRIHGAVIYGNMDPINIPQMGSHIYQHHGSVMGYWTIVDLGWPGMATQPLASA